MSKNSTKRKFSRKHKKPIKHTNKKNNRNKSVRIKDSNKSHIVHIFLEMLNIIKLYHWKTKSYAQHKATDELHENLSKNIDKFVEVLLGKDESRIRMIEKDIEIMDFSDTMSFKEKMYEYREFLTNLDRYFNNRTDSDLFSIRDDILADINQFLYLMTFDK
jgi:N-acyl-D-aspartate/D-glutamate deacylase